MDDMLFPVLIALGVGIIVAVMIQIQFKREQNGEAPKKADLNMPLCFLRIHSPFIFYCSSYCGLQRRWYMTRSPNLS